jgi:uncharacterized protein (DUF1697 family)
VAAPRPDIRIVLLRGINLGRSNRIAMPALREALTAAGFGAVRTYVQSGNVVLASELEPAALAEACSALIAARFDLRIPVVVRTHDELAAVVARNPLGDVATDPKRYQVTFLDRELERPAVARLEACRIGGERVLASGREIYAWHPGGMARSKLSSALAGRSLGVTATARNWTTVTTLLELADAP